MGYIQRASSRWVLTRRLVWKLSYHIYSSFVGYYRVIYDEVNYELITRQLTTNHEIIDPINRAQLLDDGFNLARAGLLPYEKILDLTKYLERERDYLPWEAALRGFEFIDHSLQGKDGYTEWRVSNNILFKFYRTHNVSPFTRTICIIWSRYCTLVWDSWKVLTTIDSAFTLVPWPSTGHATNYVTQSVSDMPEPFTLSGWSARQSQISFSKKPQNVLKRNDDKNYFQISLSKRTRGYYVRRSRWRQRCGMELRL